MGARNVRRMVVVLATLAAVSVAQTQNQAQPNQNQNQQQNQQAQPQPKKSFWQRMKETAAQGQNTMQQSTSAVQGTIQQGTSVIQNGAQQVQNGAQQGMQGIQQGAQFPGANGNTNGAFSGGAGPGSCGANCFDAGPFQANVSQMTMSQQGGWHVIRMNIQFHNSSNQPLTIAYHEGSMVMVDNNGATYQAAGGSPGELQGMGIDRGNQTDSQFVLNPGQTGNALFSVARGRGNDSPVGTAYSYNFTIDELQAQNGAMAIPVRSYNLNFPSLAPSAVSSSTAAFPSVSSPTKGYVGNSTGSTAGTTGYPATAVPLGAAVPSQQQRMVNGRLVPATPAAAVNNAALRSTTPTAKAPVAATAVRPIPVAPTTTAKPATSAKPTPAKKPATTTPH
jgi:hypothetical protein